MNKYNPNIHHRKSIRLKGYNYSQSGAYFITICCENKICRFGKIINNKMILNDFGFIANNEWLKLVKRFSNFELDVFQIMPNHIHGIIVLNDVVGATLAVAQNDIVQNDIIQNDIVQNNIAQNHIVQNGGVLNDVVLNDVVLNGGGDSWAGASPAPTTISDIIGAYKSLVSNGCLEIYKSKNETMGKLWQRNYHEHIIRNEQSYQNISNYIINNPSKWDEDKFYNQ